MNRLPFFVLSALISLVLISAMSAPAQTPRMDTVNVTAEPDKVHIAAQGDVSEMRIEVSDESGDVVFQSGAMTGPHLDWNMRDAQGERVSAGTYLVTVTFRNATGKLRKRVEQVIVDEAEKADTKREVTPEVAQATVTTTAPTTGGKIPKFAGTATNASSITNSVITESGGKIGIGIAPGAPTTGKLVVGGQIQTIGTGAGIKFPDNTVQKTAATGDITSVVAGSGLSGGATTGAATLSIGAGKVTNTHLATNAVTATKIAAGQVVKSINGLKDNVTLVEGSNITITPSGNTLTIAAPGASSGVIHDATLNGNGTSGSPLGVAVPLSLSGSSSNPILSVTNTGSGAAISATGAINTSTQYNIGNQRVLSIPGSGNTFGGVGAGAANSFTMGIANTFFGNAAGRTSTIGGANSFFGTGAGEFNTDGDENSFFGAGAGSTNNAANRNSYFGVNAGRFNTMGSSNSYFGYAAGQDATGAQNAFFGVSAGIKVTGQFNSGLGNHAGFDNQTGDNNVYAGYNSGVFQTNGERNTFLGSFATGADGVNESTAIGYEAKVEQSDAVVLGRTTASVGIGNKAPKAKLHVTGGKIYVEASGQGIILKSPDGTCYEITVSNDGPLVSTMITCPM
jgi:hypothetical protein